MATTTADADALPRIDKRYGDKCAALLWQLQQRECAPEQPAPASRKSALATKYGIAMPKSAGHRSAGAASAANAKTLLARPSSTRVVVPKKPSNEPAIHARARGPSQRAASSWGDDDLVQPQQLEAAQPDASRAFASPRPLGAVDRCVGTRRLGMAHINTTQPHLLWRHALLVLLLQMRRPVHRRARRRS